MSQPQASQSPGRGLLIGIIAAIAVCVLASIAFIPRAFRMLRQTRTFRMVGSSMEPTLYEDDKIAVDTGYYADHQIADGDIVVFRHNDKLLVKRVSATAGERIAAKNGRLIRNGMVLDEPYLKTPDETPASTDPTFDEADFGPRLIPPDEVFVTGDWRSMSLDSRASAYTPIHIRDIIGKVIYIYSSAHPGQQGRRF